jgi:hypothetical protein
VLTRPTIAELLAHAADPPAVQLADDVAEGRAELVVGGVTLYCGSCGRATAWRSEIGSCLSCVRSGR